MELKLRHSKHLWFAATKSASDYHMQTLRQCHIKPHANPTTVILISKINEQKNPNLAALDATARTAVGVYIAVLSKKWPFCLPVLRFPAVFVLSDVVRRVARQRNCAKGCKQFVSSLICEIWHSLLGLGCTDAYNIRVRVYTGVHTCPR